jgi:hypothetical protein
MPLEVVDGGGRVKVVVLVTPVVTVLVVVVVEVGPVVEVVLAGEDFAVVDVEVLAVSGVTSTWRRAVAGGADVVDVVDGSGAVVAVATVLVEAGAVVEAEEE